ncbi:MAG: hypothetical protein JRG89_18845 [Deltaproteobacteria bacterium]|nr:hypothetical protein [Deltaproteobacteria bacterium]MBW2390466.1 hypothetical protein [Deltaproteobacteria bacterium]
MLSKMDDYLVHQTEKPLGSVDSTHPDWQEAIYFNVHDTAGEFSAAFGLDVLPNAKYVRAYMFTLQGSEHYSYMYAGPLENWRDEMRAGTMSFSIVEPMKTWHLELADDANGIRASMDFQARCPAYLFKPIRLEEEGEVLVDQSYYNQAGTYDGSFSVGDRVFEGLQGLRARRWGPLTLSRLPFYHWISIDLPDRCIVAWQFESDEGKVLYCDGAVVSESGKVSNIIGLEHDWVLPDGSRHPTQTQLTLTLASGECLEIDCREIGSHFLGAAPPHWSATNDAALAQADATALSTEEYCEFRIGDESAFGILDIVSIPGYRRYGLTPLGS